jgi:hypothetical protein
MVAGHSGGQVRKEVLYKVHGCTKCIEKKTNKVSKFGFSKRHRSQLAEKKVK